MDLGDVVGNNTAPGSQPAHVLKFVAPKAKIFFREKASSTGF